jgi:hypothetical protein
MAVRTIVVGATVVGATVVGATVAGATVVGATVVRIILLGQKFCPFDFQKDRSHFKNLNIQKIEIHKINLISFLFSDLDQAISLFNGMACDVSAVVEHSTHYPKV